MCELDFTAQDTGQLRSPRREFASWERPENICKSGILLLVNMASNGRSSLKQKGQTLIDNNTLLRCLLRFLDGPDKPGGSLTSGAFSPSPKYAPLSSDLCGSRTENSTIRNKKISIFHRGYFPLVRSCRQNPMRLRGQREEGERGGSFGFCLRVLSADGKCK